jgi:hypothetical protein
MHLNADRTLLFVACGDDGEQADEEEQCAYQHAMDVTAVSGDLFPPCPLSRLGASCTTPKGTNGFHRAE